MRGTDDGADALLNRVSLPAIRTGQPTCGPGDPVIPAGEPPGAAAGEELAVLTALREDFPAFQIWCELAAGQPRYVARSRYLNLSPHTLMTTDLAELRQALESAPGSGPAGPAWSSAGQANIARMYDYWLNGKDHYGTDRRAADSVMAHFPEIAKVARANRAFLARVVRHVARKGVSQFIDAGSGLPASPNVHEVARQVNPDARVVYVDRDPVVLAYARALLADDHTVTAAAGDIRDPATFLTAPELTRVIDQGKPVCLLLVSVLHFLDPAEADAAVATLREWLAPGSFLVISAGTSTGTDPELIQRLQAAYRDTTPVAGRTATDIQAWFGDFTLESPGLVNVGAWHPDTTRPQIFERIRFLAGAGRKPAMPPSRP